MKVNIGKGLSLDVDAAAIPANVVEHVVYIGLRNILMDCHAGITKADNPDNYAELSLAKAQEKLAAMMAGDLRKAREGSGVVRDPVRNEALKMARKEVHAIFRPKDDGFVIVDKGLYVDVRAAFDRAEYPDDAALYAMLVESVADEKMDAAETIVEARKGAAKPASAIMGLLRK